MLLSAVTPKTFFYLVQSRYDFCAGFITIKTDDQIIEIFSGKSDRLAFIDRRNNQLSKLLPQGPDAQPDIPSCVDIRTDTDINPGRHCSPVAAFNDHTDVPDTLDHTLFIKTYAAPGRFEFMQQYSSDLFRQGLDQVEFAAAGVGNDALRHGFIIQSIDDIVDTLNYKAV